MSKAFFELLETRFGRFADLHEPASVCRVLTSKRHIDPSHLKDLLQHKVYYDIPSFNASLVFTYYMYHQCF